MATENIMSIVAFVGGGSLIASLLLNSVKQLWANLESRWGTLATQFALLVACLFVSGVAWFFQFLPLNIVVAVSSIFAGAMVLYEVFYKAFWQQGLKNNTN